MICICYICSWWIPIVRQSILSGLYSVMRNFLQSHGVESPSSCCNSRVVWHYKQLAVLAMQSGEGIILTKTPTTFGLYELRNDPEWLRNRVSSEHFCGYYNPLPMKATMQQVTNPGISRFERFHLRDHYYDIMISFYLFIWKALFCMKTLRL
jgi:hypothetical protein